jgi:uncharacterized OB-fold protein/acyl dehydratase
VTAHPSDASAQSPADSARRDGGAPVGAAPVGAAALHAEVPGLAARLVAAGEQVVGTAREPVSAPLIRQWCDAIGDKNPVYTDAEVAAGSVHGGLVAPPAMIQVWTMAGLAGKPAEAAGELLSLLKASGYTGVVATNCEQSYDRYLRPGELLRTTTRMGEFSGPKQTSLGEGYFVTWHTTWYSGDERVGQMMFRVLQFKPPGRAGDLAGPPQPPVGTPEPSSSQAVLDGSSRSSRRAQRYPLRPAMNEDTRFFWAGAEAGELRIQRCGECGARRHPPSPMCPHCHSGQHDYVVACGRGEVFSFAVHHYPPVPGREAPFVVAVVDLPEGVRVTGNVLGVPPDQVRVGLPVEVVFERVDDDLVLPQWKPAQWRQASAGPDVLPELVIPLTTTTVVTTALATRDFTPVHHDRDAARAQGSPDVFLNILTTMGLTQRFVTDWAGPRALVRAIAVRLGAPAYPADTLTMTGRVTGRGAGGAVTVHVRGVCSQGDHVTAAVRLELRGQRR